MRPMGVILAIVSFCLLASSGGRWNQCESNIFVLMGPGAIVLTWMLNGASSTAKALVIMRTPALEMLYTLTPGSGLKPSIEDTVIILPPPCSFMILATAWL